MWIHVSQNNLLPIWSPRHGSGIKSVLQGLYMHPKNEYQWEVLNLGEISVHAVFIIWAQHSWPPNSDLNKYGYEVWFIDKSWWIKLRRRKLAMKYCYSEEPWCPIVKDAMKWFVLPKQDRSLIALLMLLLLPGFVFGPLPLGNTQTALGKAKAITYNMEMTSRRVKTNLEVCCGDSALSFRFICKP